MATISLLNGKQSALLTKLSHPVLRESTDTETYSEGENKINWYRDSLDYVHKLQLSKDPVSQRMLNIFHLKQMRDHNEQLVKSVSDPERGFPS